MTIKDIFPHHEMQFAPVPNDDGDDLTRDINNDPERQDDKWQLKEDLDGDKLARFWDDALQDLGPDEANSSE